MMTSKQRVFAAILGQPRDRTPVTPLFMAWAAHLIGRTYRDYYLDSEVLVQSQLAAARLLNVDQVSVISDPWVEASAYGMQLDYPAEGVGIPRQHLIQSWEDVASLSAFDPQAHQRTRNRIQAVSRLAAEVGQTHSVLGWVEGPIAEYADLRGVQEAMVDLIDQPEMFHRAAAVLVRSAIDFARAQVDAGADTIGVGDAAASLIGPDLYLEHVVPWQEKLFEAIHDAGAMVRLHICGNSGRIMGHIPQTGADVVDVDHMVSLKAAREAVGPEVCLCGNIDPAAVLLRGTPEQVAQAARACLAEAGDRFILQPGCEVPPGTPIENLQAFCPVEDSLIWEALKYR